MHIDQSKLSEKGIRKYRELFLKGNPFDYEALDSYEYFAASQFIWEYRKAIREHRVLQRILEGVGHENLYSDSHWEGVSEEVLRVSKNLAQIILNLEDLLKEHENKIEEITTDLYRHEIFTDG